MDPNACLERFFNAEREYVLSGLDKELAQDCLNEMKEAHEELCEWLQKGGFEPNWNKFGIDKHSFLNYFETNS